MNFGLYWHSACVDAFMLAAECFCFQGTSVRVSEIGAILFKHRVAWMHGGTSLG